MSADRDSRFSSGDEPDEHFEDEDAPRSIFSAAWFRVVLVVLAVAVVGAVAVPYVLDVVNAPTSVPATGTAAAPQSPTAQSAAPSPAAQSPTAQSPTPSSTAQSSTSSSAAPASPPVAAAPKTAAPSEGASTPPSSAPTVSTPAPEKAPAVAATPKPAAPRTAAAKKDPAASPGDRPAGARQAPAAKASEGGDYFVQVGAFKEEEAAKRVATRLRDQNYPVEESVRRVGGGGAPSAAPRTTPRATASSGPDRYDVIVSGGSASEINSKLAAKGLASEAAGDGVRIRPSLSLRDAVALSKDLGGDGFKVQVRRGSSTGAPTAEPAPAPAVTGSETGGGQTLYRVRVGGYPDRAAAVTVQRELQEKGYQPYIAKGRE